MTRTCAECHYTFCPDLSGDCGQHRRRHDVWVHGVAWRADRDDDVLAEAGDRRIVVVGPGALYRLRARVTRVARRANWEVHYDFGIGYDAEATEPALAQPAWP